MIYNYYFAVASKNFLINQEPLEEILRERTQHYKSKNQEIDFWFVTNPQFINVLEKYKNYSKISNSLAFIISLDQQFILWLKLRIGFVDIGTFQSQSIFIPDSK
uniref:Ycf54 n=1 Tax=Sonderella linearis TaxID=110477 RepID=A0A1Z1MM68_9FLOR|nr:hypothetical protein [Sonderella linearis]ARW66952.1 hypothetical protein [Sonderella linearis]